MHINLKLLEAVASGELPPQSLFEIVRDHLSAICPVCRDVMEEYEAALAVKGGTGPEAYEKHFEAVRRRLGLSRRQIQEEEAHALGWVKEILGLPQSERRGRIQRAHKRFRGPLFCTMLLDEAKKAMPAEPWESLSLADAAFVACYESSRFNPDSEILVQAVSVRGNAYRALGRLKESDEDLRYARRLLEEEEVTDTLISAELDSYEGSLRKDQRRLDEAAKALHRAATLFRLLGESERVARTLVKLGLVHFQAQEFEEGIAATERALTLLGPETEVNLLGCAHYNLALLLHARGDYESAEAILDDRAEVLESAGDWLSMRVLWLRARIAWSRQDLVEAGQLFAATRERALRRGIAFDTALISLELALVCLAQGQTQEVKTLAREALQFFAAQEVHAEVFTALKLVEQAARREEATLEMFQKTIRFLEDSRSAPPVSEEPS